MSLRRLADEVFRHHHPIDWEVQDETLVSPPTRIRLVTYTVAIRPHPGLPWVALVELRPGGSFTSVNPWGWASLMADRLAEELRQQETLRRALLAEGLKPTKKRL